jgi:selenocysteine lyase/cysteine desulfurase/tRNA(Ile)-lysidine synthase TilS/MesJ
MAAIFLKVLPWYGNTHTTTSTTAHQTTLYRHEARSEVRNVVNASEHDAVLFSGSGCTGAVHLLVNALGLNTRRGKVIALVGVTEHHSNLLPWREAGAEMIVVPEDEYGRLDTEFLEEKLIEISSRKHDSSTLVVGCFCAASNITGIVNDDLFITALLHKFGALSFWDYATAAPYLNIDMNPIVSGDVAGLLAKDAIYFSMHKFVGGVQTPGVLVVKKKLFRNVVPLCGGGGGTVFFVDADNHRYLKDSELREESGTPAVVESIRAGLVIQLKGFVGVDYIRQRDEELVAKARRALLEEDNLGVLGNFADLPRLPVLSFVVKHAESGYLLHHNFICALLNDLFGLQLRGGCACAGPHAQNVLGLSQDLVRSYERVLLEDPRLDRAHLRRGHSEYSSFEVLRPGFARLNLPWFASDEEVDFVLEAVRLVARDGWKFLPLYRFNNETGDWKHHANLEFKERKWLGNISYSDGSFSFTDKHAQPPSVDGVNYSAALEEARKWLSNSEASRMALRANVPEQEIIFDEGNMRELRWFLLPSEAKAFLLKQKSATFRPPPFTPKTYARLEDRQGLSTVGSYAKKCVASDKLTALLRSGVESVRQVNGSVFQPKNEVEASSAEDEVSKSNLLGAAADVTSGEVDVSACLRSVKRDPLPLVAGQVKCHWHSPPKEIFRPFLEAIEDFDMIREGDRVLVCLSGGKDSLSLLHTLRQYKFYASKNKDSSQRKSFEIGAVTVDPLSPSYDPRPLIPYLEQLGVHYLYEEQDIMAQAKKIEASSICAFCSRMKRGRIYAAARRERYNILAFGQHLDDLAESFLMSVFHNGRLRTMKANYLVKEGDLRVIRPFAYVREKQLRLFAESSKLPVIAENCPACFENPKERHRTKQLLAQQELLFPKLYSSLRSALKPVMSISKTGIEGVIFGGTGNQADILRRLLENQQDDDED